MPEQQPSTPPPVSGASDDRGERADGPDPEVAAAAREGNPTEGTGANPWPAGGDRTAATASELIDDPEPGAGG